MFPDGIAFIELMGRLLPVLLLNLYGQYTMRMQNLLLKKLLRISRLQSFKPGMSSF
jgi:hypothetical protein